MQLVSREIPYQDPVEMLCCFADQDGLCFLDSAKQLNDLGRFSFIVFNPFLKIVAYRDRVEVDGVPIEGDPFSVLKDQLSRYSYATDKDLPPFQGGAVGYFSYDLLHYLEDVPKHPVDVLALPEMAVGFYDTVISFDHDAQRAWVVSRGAHAEARCAFVQERIALRRPVIGGAKPQDPGSSSALDPVARWRDHKTTSNFKPAAYCEMVQKVIDYIHAGDIFQANVSQCFSSNLDADMTPLNLYLKLRHHNPAPFAAFLDYGDFAIASASPERFLKLTGKQVETRPIKGTRPRSSDSIQDQLLADELLASEKDRAENTMIVDLMRNDLSRVCEDHSVVVKQWCGLESYATVHHLVSSIEGELRPECDAIDLLRATFPGGSITGAPKIRAMEIIAELEPTVRGPYCGSIGYVGFDGAMDTSIIIRTFAIKGQQVTFQAGGGIVADSTPEAEYQETLTKASALFKVLKREELAKFANRADLLNQ